MYFFFKPTNDPFLFIFLQQLLYSVAVNDSTMNLVDQILGTELEARELNTLFVLNSENKSSRSLNLKGALFSS